MPEENAPVGKKSPTTLIVVIVIIVVILLGGGYAAQRYFARKAADKIAESVLNNATGGNTSVKSSDNGVSVKDNNGSTLSGGDKATWPDSVPSTVPKFKYGTLYVASGDTTNESWTMMYQNVTDTSAATKYLAELATSGWKQTQSYDGGSVVTRMLEQGNYLLTISVDSGAKTAQISVTKKVS